VKNDNVFTKYHDYRARILFEALVEAITNQVGNARAAPYPSSTVFHTERWDVGPGESAKWMSADGRALHLIFSGDDSFSVRQTTLTTTAPAPVRSSTP
jgi:hypothetical protein